jgi:hypothetical protein
MSNPVEAAAKGHLVITSKCADGIVVTMNATVDPSNVQAYIKECQIVQKHFLAHPENVFCVISKSPVDEGHVRIVHGWKHDSAWFNKVRDAVPRLLGCHGIADRVPCNL